MGIYYKNNRGTPTDTSLPNISKDLESIRAYQFEVDFSLVSESKVTTFKLAAKQVQAAGFSVADIEVHRVNDKVYYAGKPNQDNLVVTFDNLIKDDTAGELWKWFKGTYDPLTGYLGKVSDSKTAMMQVLQLNGDLSLKSSTKYYGVYPTGYKNAEWNYSTSDFHTIEVTFRYDFMEQTTKT
tara:strand:- start:529 stop:1074 length:546 start_codon:yes stop_codon:yes gene_type:complete